MPNALRLLIIAASFPPTIGGAETYASELSRSLAEAGHCVAVLTDLPRGCDPGVVLPGDPSNVEIYRLHSYRRFLEDPARIPWEQYAFGLLPELSDIVRKFSPNIVLSNSLDAALLAKLVELDQRIPWAAAFHEQAPEAEPMGSARLRLVYEVLRPHLVLAGSELYAARARSWGVSSNVMLIYHGVDTETFHPRVDGRQMRERLGLLSDELLIVCAGRLKSRKGMRELVCAFGRVAPAYPQARLLIVGSVNSASRQYADQLRTDVEELNLTNRVSFDETMTLRAMPFVIAAADLVVQPSLEEGLGLSVLEAMASGKPVITTDIPGIREITNEPEVAFVVPPSDPESLASAIESLISNASLRARLGARGRSHVESRFSLARMTRETEMALLRLAHGPSASLG